VSLISIFSFFFLFSFTILSYTIDFTVSQLQTQQLMMSQIRLHTDYLIQTYNMLVLILYSKLVKNLASLSVFNTI